jgi:import inner membrane translocase subunit TIM10
MWRQQSGVRQPPVANSAKTISNRLVNSCHTKCIQPNPSSHRYAEGDLLKGEAVCIDRCSAKFFEVNKVVGERMSTMGGAAQASGSFGGR